MIRHCTAPVTTEHEWAPAMSGDAEGEVIDEVDISTKPITEIPMFELQVDEQEDVDDVNIPAGPELTRSETTS